MESGQYDKYINDLRDTEDLQYFSPRDPQLPKSRTWIFMITTIFNATKTTEDIILISCRNFSTFAERHCIGVAAYVRHVMLLNKFV